MTEIPVTWEAEAGRRLQFIKICLKKIKKEPNVVEHICNPRTQEAEIEGLP